MPIRLLLSFVNLFDGFIIFYRAFQDLFLDGHIPPQDHELGPGPFAYYHLEI